MKAHLRSDVPEPTCLEVTAAHPVFDDTEGMLDRSSADPHGAGPKVEARLHCFHDVLMLQRVTRRCSAGVHCGLNLHRPQLLVR